MAQSQILRAMIDRARRSREEPDAAAREAQAADGLRDLCAEFFGAKAAIRSLRIGKAGLENFPGKDEAWAIYRIAGAGAGALVALDARLAFAAGAVALRTTSNAAAAGALSAIDRALAEPLAVALAALFDRTISGSSQVAGRTVAESGAESGDLRLDRAFVSLKTMHFEADLAGIGPVQAAVGIPFLARGAGALMPPPPRQAAGAAADAARIACRAVIARLAVSMKEAMAFEAGQVIAMPDAALTRIALERASGERSPTFAVGRLGDFRGRRAIAICEDRSEGWLPLPPGSHSA